MQLMLRYLRPLRRTMIFGTTIKILATLFELALPYILSYILDSVVPTGEISRVSLWGIAMIFASLGALFGNILANQTAARVARDAARAIRHDLFEATMYLSSRETDAFTIPSLESRLTSDTYNVHHFINVVQRIGVRAPIMLIGGVIITLVLDWRLSLVLLATLPLISVSVFLITRRGLPLHARAQRSVDGMVRVVREDCNGVRVIKALSREKFECERFDQSNRTLASHERKARATMAASQPLMSLFLNLGLVAVIALGAVFVSKDLSKPGRIIAFIQYFTLMSMATTTMTRIFVQLTKSVTSADRIDEVLKTYQSHPAHIAKESTHRHDETAFLRFDDVCFSYSGKSHNLSHVSFALPRGGTLGIIGATGSGKSTLIQLLLHFYSTDSGTIYIDGRPIEDFEEEELHALFGVVWQNDFISADTVAENIRFGRDLSDEDVRRAARLAQAEDFIMAFEDGFSHMLTSKGTNISGGQRQRILIARALAGNPEILILDDASSALDYRTDAALRRAIRDEVRATTVVVAQRVSSVMHADHILVLDGGRLIGAGRHEELLASCPDYRAIRDSQMGGAFLE